MPPLIAALRTTDPSLDAKQYLAELQAAHAVLQDAVSMFMGATREAGAERGRIGGPLKRTPVMIPTDRHPWVVVETHPLGELINQCATVERLIDALTWAITSTGVSVTDVRACHPTTTDDGEFDLWLTGPSGDAIFEVSDVVRPGNNNKLTKDLKKLAGGPVQARRFLVSSPEAGEYLGGARRPTYWASRLVESVAPMEWTETDTAIFEVFHLSA